MCLYFSATFTVLSKMFQYYADGEILSPSMAFVCVQWRGKTIRSTSLEHMPDFWRMFEKFFWCSGKAKYLVST